MKSEWLLEFSLKSYTKRSLVDTVCTDKIQLIIALAQSQITLIWFLDVYHIQANHI